MTDRATLLRLMDRTAAAVSELGVLLREQARLLQAEQEHSDRLLSVRQAAADLSLSQSKVRAMVREGKLASVRVGRLVRIPSGSVEAFRERAER